jgi:hypothetical protein
MNGRCGYWIEILFSFCEFMVSRSEIVKKLRDSAGHIIKNVAI